jgi:hypothetical protein
VHHVARRERVDAQEAGAFDLAGEHQVPVQPVPAWHERREAHSDLQGDARLFREHVDGADRLHRREHRVKGCADQRARAGEVPVQVAQRGAGVDLVTAGEAAPALRAGPQVRHRPSSSVIISEMATER